MSVKRRTKAIIHRVFILPIFGARIQVIVADDITKERRKQENLFGELEKDCDRALCSRSGGHNFALFFEPRGLTRRIVAHELFHLTHDICEWVGATFDHETFACLNGELHQRMDSIIGSKIVPDGEEWAP